MRRPESFSAWARRIVNFDRSALAQAITLVESSRDEDLDLASMLLQHLPETERPAFRLGVTGAPGAGKSTIIESIGSELCDANRRVAVLAVDPSSSISGGSILGDKTRMHKLSQRSEAFIRATPSASIPGGIALATAPVIRLCEAAGYDFIIIETVGAGQGELSIADVADAILVLIDPCSGDGIQAIKKGLLELASFVAITKADGDSRALAEATYDDFERSLPRRECQLPGHLTELLLSSSINRSLFKELIDRILKFEAEILPLLPSKRLDQSKHTFLAALRHVTVEWSLNHPQTKPDAENYSDSGSSSTHPIAAAKASLAAKLGSEKNSEN